MRTFIQSSAITAILALALPPAFALADASITYRGVLLPVEGFKHIPHGGTAIHLTVEESDDGKLRGRLRAMNVDAQLSQIERIKDVLVLSTTLGEMAVTAKLTPEGEDLRGTVSVLEFVFPVVPMPADWIPREPKPFEQITTEDWLADLEYLAEALPSNHKDWHALINKDAWRKKVAKTKEVISSGSSEIAHAALVELVAAGRDPHTNLSLMASGVFKSAPVRLLWLPNGLFVTAAPSDAREIIGGRVQRIGKVATKSALRRLARLRAWDNLEWKRHRVVGLVPIPRLLHALGLSDTPEMLALEVRCRDGKDRQVSFHEGRSETLVEWPKALGVKPPLWLTRRKEAYWFTSISENDDLYIAYNRCQEDPSRPFSEFTKDIMSELKRGHTGRVIIDLRHNSGGNSALIKPLLSALAKNKLINQPDRLFVLIGPATFSSGMLCALQFRDGTRATLVGEPTGGKPNQFGEISQRFLPKSGLRLYVSTKYYDFDPSDPPSVRPNLRAELKSSDLFAGRDPVMKKVRSIPIESPGRR